VDDSRRTLGVFVSLRTPSLLTVVAVLMQQIASDINKLRRVFNHNLCNLCRQWLTWLCR